MRIACPVCNAVYQVPDEQLREGQLVRCARCGSDWAPVIEVPADDPADAVTAEPIPEPEVKPEPEPEREPEPAPPRRMALDDEEPAPQPAAEPIAPAAPVRHSNRALMAAWIVSLLLVGGAVTLGLVGRERIMQAWPPSIRLYTALHLAPLR